MSIQVDGLGKRFGARWAVRELSFSVKTGEIMGLLGPNGAGKSTTMRMLTGYLTPTQGHATINDHPIDSVDPSWRLGLGYLPELNPLYTELYASEYLRYVAGLYQIKKPKLAVDRVVQMTGLQEYRNKRIKVLSKGYRQRVGLAATLIPDPQTLILDEPTNGLDPNQIVEMRQAIRSVGQEKAILLSSHIMQEVEALCDSVTIVSQGRLMAAGKTDEVMRQKTGSTVVVAFAESIESQLLHNWFPEATIDSLPNGEWAINASQKDIRAELFQRAVQSNLTLTTLYERKSHLEDVFRLLTSASA